MTLYNLVNMACTNCPPPFSTKVDYPSWMQIGEDPLRRIYLVSNNLEAATKAANQFNCQSIENSNLVVKELSMKGRLRYYAGKFLCHLLSEPNDLDSPNKRLEELFVGKIN